MNIWKLSTNKAGRNSFSYKEIQVGGKGEKKYL